MTHSNSSITVSGTNTEGDSIINRRAMGPLAVGLRVLRVVAVEARQDVRVDSDHVLPRCFFDSAAGSNSDSRRFGRPRGTRFDFDQAVTGLRVGRRHAPPDHQSNRARRAGPAASGPHQRSNSDHCAPGGYAEIKTGHGKRSVAASLGQVFAFFHSISPCI
jgi:hypothetical protein